MSQIEHHLLDQCLQHGDCDSIVLKYYNMVFYTVKKVNPRYSNEDVEDMTQEIFLQLFKDDYKKLRQYNEQKGLSLSGWIRLIATRIVYNANRKHTISDTIQFDSLEEEIWLDRKTCHISKPTISTHDIEDIMHHMSYRDQLIMKLFYIKGLSLDDMSVFMKMDKKKLYYVKSRAVGRFKKLYLSRMNNTQEKDGGLS